MVNRIRKIRKAQPGAIRHFISIIATSFILSRMRPYSYSIAKPMAIIEIFKSCFLKLVPLIFPQDISNWMIKSVVFSNPYFMLLSPRLQLVCLGRGLVGYWKGYFNHKRCRRRCIFKLRRYEFLYILNPRRIPLLLNKVFDLLRKCGLCYYKSFLSNFIQFHNENPEWTNCVTSEILKF